MNFVKYAFDEHPGGTRVFDGFLPRVVIFVGVNDIEIEDEFTDYVGLYIINGELRLVRAIFRPNYDVFNATLRTCADE